MIMTGTKNPIFKAHSHAGRTIHKGNGKLMFEKSIPVKVLNSQDNIISVPCRKTMNSLTLKINSLSEKVNPAPAVVDQA